MTGKTKKTEAGGNYFPPESTELIPSGSILLDCVLGGGWALGRTVNIVGDKSCGKTLLAIEAAANFARRFPKGYIAYREAEGAFDLPYAETVGLPPKRVDFGAEGVETLWDTIESIAKDFEEFLDDCIDNKVPGLYIIDSLDALVSEADLERKPGETGYNLEKVKAIGRLFSINTRKQRAAGVCLFIISQIRDNIGVTYGKKYKRSGGRSIDFYASQVLYLSYREQVKRSASGVERAVGVRIHARTEKNKINDNFRDCELTILYHYGMDDLAGALRWLKTIGQLDLLGIKKDGTTAFLNDMNKCDDATYKKRMGEVRGAVEKAWLEIERELKPTRRKYA